MPNRTGAQCSLSFAAVRRLRAALFLCIISFAPALVNVTGSRAHGYASVRAGLPPQQAVATPTVTTAPAQNGAVIVTLADPTSGAVIYYTTDGSTPTASSTRYFAPFLVASSLRLKAIAVSASLSSPVASQVFSTIINSGKLVWSEEFSNPGGSNARPNPSTWTYDTGTNCCGNHELETYCAWGSDTNACKPSNPNAYVGTDGYLHVIALKPSADVYTSARLKSEGHFSFQYGRIEARMMLPESQGMWPAFWLLGNNIATLDWPACGEADVMEHIDGSNPPPYAGAAPVGYDWIEGSVHGGNGRNSQVNLSQRYRPAGFSAAEWHTYGMIWTKGQIQYYVDNPSDIYATFNPGNFNGPWPFDQGPMFILLNLAVGGTWPGDPDTSTVFPSSMLVDCVRIYTN